MIEHIYKRVSVGLSYKYNVSRRILTHLGYTGAATDPTMCDSWGVAEVELPHAVVKPPFTTLFTLQETRNLFSQFMMHPDVCFFSSNARSQIGLHHIATEMFTLLFTWRDGGKKRKLGYIR